MVHSLMSEIMVEVVKYRRSHHHGLMNTQIIAIKSEILIYNINIMYNLRYKTCLYIDLDVYGLRSCEIRIV